MLQRNLCLLALGSALTLGASAHEFTFGAGALSNTMFSQLSYTNTTLFGTANNDVQVSATGTTITGEFYVGYAYNINKGFDIGLEIFYDLDGPEVEQIVAEPRYLKYSMKNAIGVRVVPGFNITPSTRLIADVGYLYMETNISVIDLVTASDYTATSVSKKTGMIVYGVGIETMMYESFGLRASYNVAPRMGTVDSTNNAASITSTDGTVTYTGSPVLSMFYLGGIVKFTF